MRPEEIAAYIGAAAWLPQISAWAYQAAVRPRLRAIPDQIAEVGFTAYGPIFNVRIAFFVEHRDLVVDGLDLVVRHQDGESQIFTWAGLGETFSEITDSSGNRQIVSRDQSPIAMKVVVQSLSEKFVRFQEPRFHSTDRALTKILVEHFNYLKKAAPESFVTETLSSRQFFDVVDNRKNCFRWKAGRYELHLKPKSPQRFKVLGGRYAFELSQSDVDHVRENIATIEQQLRNIVVSNLDGAEQASIRWNWANVAMQVVDP